MSLSLRGARAAGVFQDSPMAAPSYEELSQNMFLGGKKYDTVLLIRACSCSRSAPEVIWRRIMPRSGAAGDDAPELLWTVDNPRNTIGRFVIFRGSTCLRLQHNASFTSLQGTFSTDASRHVSAISTCMPWRRSLRDIGPVARFSLRSSCQSTHRSIASSPPTPRKIAHPTS
jgi:hypothetical protein